MVPTLRGAVGRVEELAGARVRITISPATGSASFVSMYGQSLGLPDATQLVVTRAEGPDEVGMEHVRLQQTHRGIPVAAGIMTVHLRGASVVAIHAKTLPELGEIDVSPRVAAPAALSFASTRTGRNRGSPWDGYPTDRGEIAASALTSVP